MNTFRLSLPNITLQLFWNSTSSSRYIRFFVDPYLYISEHLTSLRPSGLPAPSFSLASLFTGFHIVRKRKIVRPLVKVL